MKTAVIILVLLVVVLGVLVLAQRMPGPVVAAQSPDAMQASGVYCQQHNLRTRADVRKALGEPEWTIWKYGDIEVYMNPVTGRTPFGEFASAK